MCVCVGGGGGGGGGGGSSFDEPLHVITRCTPSALGEVDGRFMGPWRLL